MHGYLRHLANFARVVEAGSLKAASELLGVAPSGLSDSVRILEQRLGAPLLVRRKAGVAPTSEGERVYRNASQIVDLLEDTLSASEAGGLSGPCRISVPAEVAETILGRGLVRLSADHPSIDVSVFVEDEIVDHSRFGRDFFFRISSTRRGEAGLRPVWTTRANAILVAAPTLLSAARARDPAAVERLPFIGATAASGPGTPGGLTFDRHVPVSAAAARLALARQGVGVAACIDACVASDLAAGRLRHVLRDQFAVPLEMTLSTPHRRRNVLETAMIAACEAMTAPAERAA